MSAVAKQTVAWLEAFIGQPPAPAWLQSLRDAAFARFAELGFPTTHNEEWRFTNVSAIARTAFAPGAPDVRLVYPDSVKNCRRPRPNPNLPGTPPSIRTRSSP